jgi:hypothetical protein
MPSIWLTGGIAWIWINVAFITSGVVAFDIFVRGHRQQMGVMDRFTRSPRCKVPM